MWPLAETVVNGRGRCLVASRDIAAGETVLSEQPALLFVHPEFEASVCACCLRTVQEVSSVSCELCRRCRFCSAKCNEESSHRGGAHSPEVCAGLRFLSACTGVGIEEQHLGRFILQVYSMKAAARHSAVEATRFAGIEGLAMPDDGPAEIHRRLAAALHPVVVNVFVNSLQLLPPADVSVDEISALLAKEAVNGFCIMASGGDEQRAVRGTVVCLHAARLNHGCFPNVARFDYFDASRSDSTLLHFKAIDPIPAGAELLISYFPVTLPRMDRRLRLLNDYGFQCRRALTCLIACRVFHCCDRCSIEAQAAGGGGSMVVDGGGSSGEEDWEQGGDGYSPEYAIWFLKNVCPRPGCGGTLAPPTPTADVMECNYCGHLRSDAAFYAELEH